MNSAPSTEEFLKVILKFNNSFVNASAGSLGVAHLDPNLRLKAVKDILVSLQSFSKRPPPSEEEIRYLDTALFLSRINRTQNILYIIIREPTNFHETIILSSLALSFLSFNSVQHCRMSGIYALESYFRFFVDDNVRYSYLCDVEETLEPKSIKNLIQFKIKSDNFKFADIACLYGLFNCTHMMRTFIHELSDQFFSLHDLILKLFKSPVSEEYHLFQVFRDYIRILLENYILMRSDVIENNVDLTAFSDYSILKVVKKSMAIIDNRWECFASNIGKMVKEAYNYLIKICSNLALDKSNYVFFISREFRSVINYPYTCKSKYNKLAILMQNLSSFSTPLKLVSGDNREEYPAYSFPFNNDPEFSKKVFQNLSINSLTHSIVEFYKKSLEVIAFAHSNDPPEVACNMWSTFWLEALKNTFVENMLESSIVHNTIVSHILPFTLKIFPDSFSLLWNALAQFPYGQVSIVKIHLRKNCYKNISDQLPDRIWLEEMLQLGDDMSRLEALSLLVEENFIYDNRTLVCELVLKFLRCNLNIDNANIRQKIVSIVEGFYKKIIPSLSTRYTEKITIDSMPLNDKNILKFLKDSFDFLMVSLIPGSSFQRKFTALSMFSSLLKVFDKEDPNHVFVHLFKQLSTTNYWHHLLIYGLVDKDDRIRKMITEALINISSHYLGELCEFENEFFQDIYQVSMKLLKSPRHQETHIGGLMLKYLFYSFHVNSGNNKISNPGFELLKTLVNRASFVFHSETFRSNIVIASRKDPLHGYLLALNQIMYSSVFMKGIAQQNVIENDTLTLLIKQLPFRDVLFFPLFQLSMECIEYFLKVLTPIKSSVESEKIYQNDSDNIYDDSMLSSPSFYEMGQRIVQIILDSDESISEEQRDDIFQSNEFRLILSMAWLNIKEACFLLTSLVSCFTSMLELFVQNLEISHYRSATKAVLKWITPQELYLIGTKITSIMLRCRHKGVIEAAGKSLSIYTQRMIQIQRYLRILQGQEMISLYCQAMDSFVKSIVEIVDSRNTNASVTRRAAGLAFITQAVLSGEVMTREDSNSNELITYNRIVQLLIQNSQRPVINDASQMNDLPQANSLHVLRSIVTTSELSQFTMKTVVDLFPICVTGFRSPHFPIRNACLQLFGACVQRMLGQKKRVKTADSDLGQELGTTITFEEFASRFPKLVPVIIDNFNGLCFDDVIIERRRHDLVPIITLLAKFTASPENNKENEFEFINEKNNLIHLLKSYLKSPIYKIRELSARALKNFMNWSDFEDYIFSLPNKVYSFNEYHGLNMFCKNMFEKYDLGDRNNSIMKFIDKFRPNRKNVSNLINLDLLHYDSVPLDVNINDDDLNTESDEILKKSSYESDASSGFHEFSYEVLIQLNDSISYKNSDIIRKEGSNSLYKLILNGAFCDDPKLMAFFYSIVLKILQDEERDVRFVGQKIVAALEAKQKFADQTSSIEAVLEMLIDKPFHKVISQNETVVHNFTSSIVEHFLHDMFSNAEMKYCRIQFRQNEIYDDEVEFLLFEKEQKNVFSEPYLMSTRIGSFLIMIVRRSPEYFIELFTRYDKFLHAASEDIEHIMDGIQFNNIEKLVLLSIWRLPEFINHLINLLYLLKISVTLRLNMNFCRIIQRIEMTFPFLVKNASLVVREKDYEDIPLKQRMDVIIRT